MKKAGRIHKTLRVMNNDIRGQAEEHSKTLRELIADHSVTHIMIERYMSRRMGGVTIECVNCMIGIAVAVAISEGVKIKVIPASQWKNETNRVIPGMLDGMYSTGKASGVTAHTIDATMIALYAKHTLIGIKPFSTTDPQKVVDAINKIGICDIGVMFKKPRKVRKINRRNGGNRVKKL